jgi:hypothetical protein
MSMENNPYDPYELYDPTVPWVPEQRQAAQGARPKEEPFYEYPEYYAHSAHYMRETQRQEAAPPGQQVTQQGAAKPARMSKADTLEVADAFKKFLLIASMVGFGVLGVLAAGHVTGVTSSQVAPSSSSSVPSFNSPGSQSPSNDDNSGGFFNQGNQGNQGGYQFGSGNSQPPFTNSRTS